MKARAQDTAPVHPRFGKENLLKGGFDFFAGVIVAKSIGFIGAGNMAEALMRGIISKKLYGKKDIIASEIYEPRRKFISDSLGVDVTADSADVVRSAKFVVVAVKPQQIGEAMSSLRGLFTKDHLVMSIAAGVTIETLTAHVPDSKIVRVMPNQPCMVLASASAFACGRNVTEDDKRTVKGVLDAVGISVELKEELLDAVTGVSGSGPAYAYMMIGALSDGGVLMGLPRDVSTRLAAQTLYGAAKTILETGEHPDKMKDIVCSPGGTTIEAVKVLEDYSMRAAVISAVEAATMRSKELGKK